MSYGVADEEGPRHGGGRGWHFAFTSRRRGGGESQSPDATFQPHFYLENLHLYPIE